MRTHRMADKEGRELEATVYQRHVAAAAERVVGMVRPDASVDEYVPTHKEREREREMRARTRERERERELRIHTHKLTCTYKYIYF
jgi:hypothetical protein